EIDGRDARIEPQRHAQVGDSRDLEGGRRSFDGIQIRDVELGQFVMTDVAPRQIDRVADRLILIASSRIGADRAAVPKVDDADYAHERAVSDVLCSLTAFIRW